MSRRKPSRRTDTIYGRWGKAQAFIPGAVQHHWRTGNLKVFGKIVAKYRWLVIVMAVALLVPAGIGYLRTRVNYDILSYLPDSLETVYNKKWSTGGAPSLIYIIIYPNQFAKFMHPMIIKTIAKTVNILSV